MSENLKLWNSVKRPPETALKTIKGGRLSGMTDISPQWRYQAMTEQCGPCGIGWKYEIKRLWLEAGTEGQQVAFAEIALYVKYDAIFKEGSPEWGDPVPGVGGSMFIAKEKDGLRTSDEAFKMAVTDALSVAMKQLGVGADIYMGMWDGSKYKEQKHEAPKVVSITTDPVDQDHVNTAAKWLKEKIDEDTIETNWKIVQAGYNKLSNNERMALDTLMQDKAPGSNRAYKNILKDYLSYTPKEGVAN